MNETMNMINEQSITYFNLRLQDESSVGNLRSYYERQLTSCLQNRSLYNSHELQLRPKVQYADWLIVFEDDADMIDFLETEIEENECSWDEIYLCADVEYVLMTGYELGQLPPTDM